MKKKLEPLKLGSKNIMIERGMEVREIIKELELNNKIVQLLGGSKYTVRGIYGDKTRDEDFSLGQYDKAKDFYESITDLMIKTEGTK